MGTIVRAMYVAMAAGCVWTSGAYAISAMPATDVGRPSVTGKSTACPSGHPWDVANEKAQSASKADKTATKESSGNAHQKTARTKSKGSSAEQRRIIFVGGKHRSSNGAANANGGKATNNALNPQPIPPGKRVDVVPGLAR